MARASLFRPGESKQKSRKVRNFHIFHINKNQPPQIGFALPNLVNMGGFIRIRRKLAEIWLPKLAIFYNEIWAIAWPGKYICKRKGIAAWYGMKCLKFFVTSENTNKTPWTMFLQFQENFLFLSLNNYNNCHSVYWSNRLTRLIPDWTKIVKLFCWITQNSLAL